MILPFMPLFNFMLSFLFLFSFATCSIDALVKEDIPIQKCSNNRVDKRKGELALCAIFRDEADYLKEWIEYHRLVGVSHFYLYNNFSGDNFWSILKPYINNGVVELFDVPFDSYGYRDGAATHNFVQVCCYNHAIELARDFNDWLGIIDIDEFICPVIDKTILKALERYDYAGGLVVYWQIYGTSNVWNLEPGELLIEKLLLKQPNLGGNGLFKSIVRPKYARCLDPHWTAVDSGPLVTPNHQRFSHTPNFALLPVDVIRINHYTYRTDSYYYHVKKARRQLWGENMSPEEERARLDFANSVYDPVMLKFVSKLKSRLFAQ